MPGISKKDVNSRTGSVHQHSEVHMMLSARTSLKLNASHKSPGKAQKKKMALPRRIVRLLESSKMIHFQNVSLSKKRQMCINRPISRSVAPGPRSGTRSSHVSSFHSKDSAACGENSDKRSIPSQNADDSLSASQSTTHNSDVVAIDCEMVGIGPRGRFSALARCSIVDRDGGIVYDQYIKPEEPVTDFRTKWSGIRPKNLVDAVPFEEAKNDISNILKGRIVVGHAICNDFQALDLSHPTRDVRDTSKCQSLVELFGRKCKPGQNPGLKALAKHLLGLEIQKGEHSSVEDACATMELYKLVEKKWEEEIQSTFPDQQYRTSFLDDHFWPDDLL